MSWVGLGRISWRLKSGGCWGLAVLLGLALVSFGLGSAGTALAQETGAGNGPDSATGATVEIEVAGFAVNGTQDGATPAGKPVSLHTIDPVAGRVATLTTTTDDQGGFLFAPTPYRADFNYVLVMDYAGMRYNSLLEPEDLTQPAQLTVYETTQDIGAMQVNRQTMIIAGINEKDREIAVLELLSLSNIGDRTLLPQLTNIANPNEISFLRFSLPTQAGQLEVQSSLPGGDIITIGNGFALTAPVLPGEHQVSYSYRFPYQEDRVVFNQRLIQGAKVYQVLAPEEWSEIKVAPLTVKPRIFVEGKVYLVWEGTEIPPGQGVMLELSQLPQPDWPTRMLQALSDSRRWEWGIPALLGAALAGLLLYAWVWGQRPSLVGSGGRGAGDANHPPVRPEVSSPIDGYPADNPGGSAGGDLSASSRGAGAEGGESGVGAPGSPGPQRQEELVTVVAQLDDQFERGRLSVGEYQERREDLLRQLRQLSPSANPSEAAAEGSHPLLHGPEDRP